MEDNLDEKYIKKENYVHNFSLKWRLGHIYAVVFREHKKLMNGKILYLGCNSGTSVCVLSPHCDSVVGVDINENAIKSAKKLARKHKIKNVEFVCSNVCKMPFPDNSFDGVYAFQILEHIYPEDMDMVLNEIKRVTKTGGNILVETPTPENNYYRHSTHKFFFDNEYVIRKVLDGFFDIKKIQLETRYNPKSDTGTPHNDWLVVMKNV